MLFLILEPYISCKHSFRDHHGGSWVQSITAREKVTARCQLIILGYSTPESFPTESWAIPFGSALAGFTLLWFTSQPWLYFSCLLHFSAEWACACNLSLPGSQLGAPKQTCDHHQFLLIPMGKLSPIYSIPQPSQTQLAEQSSLQNLLPRMESTSSKATELSHSPGHSGLVS